MIGTALNGLFAPEGGRATTKNIFVATDGLDANDGLSRWHRRRPFRPR